MYNFLQSASYAVYGIGGGAGDKSSDLNGFPTNEKKGFALWASVFESSRLVISLKWTSDQKVAYVLIAFEWN